MQSSILAKDSSNPGSQAELQKTSQVQLDTLILKWKLIGLVNSSKNLMALAASRTQGLEAAQRLARELLLS